jgi:hypothetical protein
MTDSSDNGSPYSASGALTLKGLIPYFFAIAAFGYAVWGQANNASQLQSTQVFQGQQIAQLIADDKAGQTLSYSISSQLAQLNQSVADIKANTTHGAP